MRNIVQIHASRNSGGNETVAANIRAELGYLGEKQNVLASVLGLSEMAVSRRLADKTEFTAGEIVLIADYFGIAPGELFIDRGRQKPKKAPTQKSESRTLPELDSNQQPAGSQLAPVTPLKPTTQHTADHNSDATITQLFG